MTEGIKPAWGNSIYQRLALFLQQANADCQDRAVLRSDVLKWLHREAGVLIDDRAMRKHVAKGVMSGEFPVICTGSSGYYVTQDPKEIKAAIENLEGRVEKLSIRLAGLRAAHREAERRKQECARGQDEGHRFQGNMFQLDMKAEV